jgi:hypothetical protein
MHQACATVEYDETVEVVVDTTCQGNDRAGGVAVPFSRVMVPSHRVRLSGAHANIPAIRVTIPTATAAIPIGGGTIPFVHAQYESSGPEFHFATTGPHGQGDDPRRVGVDLISPSPETRADSAGTMRPQRRGCGAAIIGS